MSLTKSEVKPSDFIDSKHLSKPNGKQVSLKLADQLSTPSLVWLLTKRHKVGLLAIGNIVLVLNWAFPAWPELIRSLI